YVLGYFGRNVSEARENYVSYVLAGVDQGRRPELVGGGFIRSLGGWKEIKKSNLKTLGRVKSDERILGESDFVLRVLEEAEERLERYYELKRQGYDLQWVEQRVCETFQLEPEDIYSKSREKVRADARALYCYWAVKELGYRLTDLARRLGMTQPGVGYAVRRGEKMAKERSFQFPG
ncbi:MAG: transposase, partial [Deltaproteobacteria bacterium]|nr:transposase [Deltaproteobacteria bacterium]